MPRHPRAEENNNLLQRPLVSDVHASFVHELCPACTRTVPSLCARQIAWTLCDRLPGCLYTAFVRPVCNLCIGAARQPVGNDCAQPVHGRCKADCAGVLRPPVSDAMHSSGVGRAQLVRGKLHGRRATARRRCLCISLCGRQTAQRCMCTGSARPVCEANWATTPVHG